MEVLCYEQVLALRDVGEWAEGLADAHTDNAPAWLIEGRTDHLANAATVALRLGVSALQVRMIAQEALIRAGQPQLGDLVPVHA